jgi:hypothetical protein
MEGSLMAFKVFTNGSTLQASEVNENLMRQSVAVFSNAAARTAAITAPSEGMLTYLEDSNRYEFYNGSLWASPFGLTQIVNQTIGSAVTSVTLSNIFSSAYDAYKIVLSGGASSATNSILRLQLGSDAFNHSTAIIYSSYTGSPGVTSLITANASSFRFFGIGQSTGLYSNFDLFSPFRTTPTLVNGSYSDNTNTGSVSGAHTASTSFTSATIFVESGTITGGNVAVYGYRKVA